MRVWTYVIANDRGSAPNYDKPAVTLAVCKPRVRRAARVGDLVIAFSGRKIAARSHSVRWAGIVGEVIPLEKYWNDKRFRTKRPGNTEKPDNFYKQESHTWRQVENSTHGLKHMERDLRGVNTLVFYKAWHFFSETDDLPLYFNLRMPFRARRGHRVSDISKQKINDIIRWLCRQNSRL